MCVYSLYLFDGQNCRLTIHHPGKCIKYLEHILYAFFIQWIVDVFLYKFYSEDLHLKTFLVSGKIINSKANINRTVFSYFRICQSITLEREMCSKWRGASSLNYQKKNSIIQEGKHEPFLEKCKYVLCLQNANKDCCGQPVKTKNIKIIRYK